MRFEEACITLGLDPHTCIRLLKRAFTAAIARLKQIPHGRRIREAAEILARNPRANTAVTYAAIFEAIRSVVLDIAYTADDLIILQLPTGVTAPRSILNDDDVIGGVATQ